MLKLPQNYHTVTHPFLKTARRHNFTLISALSAPIATHLPITGHHKGDKETHEGDTLVPAVQLFKLFYAQLITDLCFRSVSQNTLSPLTLCKVVQTEQHANFAKSMIRSENARMNKHSIYFYEGRAQFCTCFP